MKTIAINNCEFNRLTFVHGRFEYILDLTGKLNSGSTMAVFRGFYDDYADNKWFCIFHADCAWPNYYLINARSFEDAYDVFMDKFADIPDPRDEPKTEEAEKEVIDNGTMTLAPNGPRTQGGSAWRWCEDIQGFEVALVKAEVIQ